MKLKPPTPVEIRAAREAARMTQTEAAQLVHLANYKRWSEYETGASDIDLARWELFLLKSAPIIRERHITPPPPRKGRPPSWALAKPAKKRKAKSAKTAKPAAKRARRVGKA